MEFASVQQLVSKKEQENLAAVVAKARPDPPKSKCGPPSQPDGPPPPSKKFFAFLKKLDNHPAQFVITDHVEALTSNACTDPDVIEGLIGAEPEHLATLDSLQGRYDKVGENSFRQIPEGDADAEEGVGCHKLLLTYFSGQD